MSARSAFKTLWSRFRKSHGGNVSVVAAFAALPLLIAAGVAIDYGRLYSARIDVKAALDAAVLAGTRNLMDSGDKKAAIAVAQSYFISNLPRYATLENNTITFSVRTAGDGIESSGNAEMKTTIMGLLNQPTMSLFADAGASGSSAKVGTAGPAGDLEISLMLDVTGSMCDDGNGPCTSSKKLDALKQAAAKLVDTVVWPDQSAYTSRVAVIPFSTRVRVAPDGTSSSTTAVSAHQSGADVVGLLQDVHRLNRRRRQRRSGQLDLHQIHDELLQQLETHALRDRPVLRQFLDVRIHRHSTRSRILAQWA